MRLKGIQSRPSQAGSKGSKACTCQIEVADKGTELGGREGACCSKRYGGKQQAISIYFVKYQTSVCVTKPGGEKDHRQL